MNEPPLANPRFPRDPDHLALPAPHQREALVQQGQFGLTSHQVAGDRGQGASGWTTACGGAWTASSGASSSTVPSHR